MYWAKSGNYTIGCETSHGLMHHLIDNGIAVVTELRNGVHWETGETSSSAQLEVFNADLRGES